LVGFHSVVFLLIEAGKGIGKSREAGQDRDQELISTSTKLLFLRLQLPPHLFSSFTYFLTLILILT